MKCCDLLRDIHGRRVALRGRAWIEIDKVKEKSRTSGVALRGRAWIEI